MSPSASLQTSQPSSESAEVSIPAEGTVYDALMATGWDVQAEDSDYGKYVTSINGIATGSNTGLATAMVTTMTPVK